MGIYKTIRALALTAAATTMAAAPVWAAEEESKPLAPNSKWILNYADDSCRLIRGFGEGEDASAFYIERYGPGENFAMLLAGKPFRKLSKRTNVTIRFGPDEAEQVPNFFEGDFGDFGPAMIFGNLSVELPETAGMSEMELDAYFEKERAEKSSSEGVDEIGEAREKAIQWLSVSAGKKDEVTLDLGSMGKPFAALRTCTDKLLTSWGVETEKLASQTRAVIPVESPGEWLKPSDYPLKMIKAGQQSLLQVRLSVDAEGKPSACHIQQSTRPPEFDEIVCKRLMQRARFESALDAVGQPFASYWRASVRFQLPS